VQPIAAYALVLAGGFDTASADRRDASRRTRRETPSSPRPGLGSRLRGLRGGGPRLAREPGFAAAASPSWIDPFVPKLIGYPTAGPATR
jgi:hypothetical protein